MEHEANQATVAVYEQVEKKAASTVWRHCPSDKGGTHQSQHGKGRYNQAWPEGWGYDDDVYVEYIDGGYYMINPRHPGLHLTLNIF